MASGQRGITRRRSPVFWFLVVMTTTYTPRHHMGASRCIEARSPFPRMSFFLIFLAGFLLRSFHLFLVFLLVISGICILVRRRVRGISVSLRLRPPIFVILPACSASPIASLCIIVLLWLTGPSVFSITSRAFVFFHLICAGHRVWISILSLSIARLSSHHICNPRASVSDLIIIAVPMIATVVLISSSRRTWNPHSRALSLPSFIHARSISGLHSARRAAPIPSAGVAGIERHIAIPLLLLGSYIRTHELVFDNLSADQMQQRGGRQSRQRQLFGS